jgi:hypothetical protein
VIIFVMVDGSLDWLFTTTPILAHQMPQASAVHHITVNRKSKGSVPFVCYISCTLKGITTFAPRAGELVQLPQMTIALKLLPLHLTNNVSPTTGVVSSKIFSSGRSSFSVMSSPLLSNILFIQ